MRKNLDEKTHLSDKSKKTFIYARNGLVDIIGPIFLMLVNMEFLLRSFMCINS